VAGLPLVVLPDVFNPALFFSSEVLAGALDGPMVRAGMRVLDMGTGTGIGAILAARLGASVVAVDISREAVRCAKINALLNGVEDSVDVRHGDLFAPVQEERFDLVLFNPPFYEGTPSEEWEFAWRSRDALDRFARQLPNVLAPGGRAILVRLSKTTGAEQAPAECGLRSRVLSERDLISERLKVVEWSLAGEAVPA
jgi:HemK-related putative methylase